MTTRSQQVEVGTMMTRWCVDLKCGVDSVFDYLIGHSSLLVGVSSGPLLGTAGARFNNTT